MELRHLRYFSAVATEGGFGRAAATLNLAQPALSRQIRGLEEEVGLELLERTPRGVTTTHAGDAFLAGSAAVIAAVEQAVEAARRAAAGREGRCVIGVGRVMLEAGGFTDAIAAIREYLPDVDLTIEEVFSYDQPGLIAGGQLDVGFCTLESNLDELSHEIWTVRQLDHAMVALDHRLAGRKELEPGDVADEPVLFLSPRRGERLANQFAAALDAAGIRSPREFTFASPQSAMMIIASGRGWGPSPADLGRGQFAGVTTVPLRGLVFPVQVDFVWRRRETRPVVLAVLEVLRATRDGRAPRLPEMRSERRPPVGLPGGLQLRQLRSFVAVADEGSFGRAAERLDVTQPSLSRQIADLEHELGVELLRRGPRGATLTDAGRALRKSVNKVFDELDAVLGTARQAQRWLRSRCVIGGVHTAAASRILGAAIRRAGELHPGLELVFEDYPSPRQPDALREGLIDVGICNAYVSVPDDPDIAHERLLDDSIEYALLADSHPLASRGSIMAPELAGIPFLFMSRSFHPPFHDRVMAKLASLGLRPLIEAGYDSLPVIWVMAAEGRGWALGFGTQCARPPAGLVAVPVQGLHIAWGLDMLWRRKEANPAVAKVLAAIRGARKEVSGR